MYHKGLANWRGSNSAMILLLPIWTDLHFPAQLWLSEFPYSKWEWIHVPFTISVQSIGVDEDGISTCSLPKYSPTMGEKPNIRHEIGILSITCLRSSEIANVIGCRGTFSSDFPLSAVYHCSENVQPGQRSKNFRLRLQIATAFPFSSWQPQRNQIFLGWLANRRFQHRNC